jgi:prevent-host-death family protein
MGEALKLDLLEALPHTSASDVKKLGWRGVMKVVRTRGKIVVTNHNDPEAVIILAEEYDIIQRSLQKLEQSEDAILDTLRQQFDVRLAALAAADGGDRLRDVMRQPAQLGGEVKAGASY